MHEPDDMALALLPDWLRALCQETARGRVKRASLFLMANAAIPR